MISATDVILRLSVSAVLGSLIGIERERLSWAAGLRTHMLVSVGSTLIMLVSAYGFAHILESDKVVLDPSRMAAQVVSGIGFLGAGSILLRGEIIRGLTTAASLWTVAAIGLAVGGGMYVAAVTGTSIVLIILAGIKPLERRFFADKQKRGIRLLVLADTINISHLPALLGNAATRVSKFAVKRAEDERYDEVFIIFSRLPEREFNKVMQTLMQREGVQSFHHTDE
ncbi:MgtC/SapB family protein [Herbaspirillum sp. WGmk3]|uniref:MgtC/SapB family protein n=1 Tax=Herbaspirillum sp. WGmk3 TaxID=2919925 RepID=UPI002091DC1E|nr:MgtC/SapB family protein [Herbaspirillum sp. WGmk3]MCO4858084.1 MgtC/SapB family protein [Herbaspirillum sp. WGmk3]